MDFCALGKYMKKLLKNTFFLSAVGIAVLVIAWGIAYFVVGNEYVLPSPWETVVAAGKVLGESYFYSAFFGTLGRAFFAFFIACVFGGGLAIIAYLYPTFEKIFGGIVAVLRSLPTMSALLIVLLCASALGKAHSVAPVIIGVMTLLPMLYTAGYTSLLGVDEKLLEMCKIYQVPKRKQLTWLFVPIALMKFCAEALAALSFALKLIVSAEILAFTYGSVGGLMQEANLNAEIAVMMALTLIVCAVGILIEVVGAWGLKRLGEKLCA